jgi:hypothetical protein
MTSRKWMLATSSPMTSRMMPSVINVSPGGMGLRAARMSLFDPRDTRQRIGPRSDVRARDRRRIQSAHHRDRCAPGSVPEGGMPETPAPSVPSRWARIASRRSSSGSDRPPVANSVCSPRTTRAYASSGTSQGSRDGPRARPAEERLRLGKQWCDARSRRHDGGLRQAARSRAAVAGPVAYRGQTPPQSCDGATPPRRHRHATPPAAVPDRR